jgi:glycosyltransferase involved in cell wall biosynthesis
MTRTPARVARAAGDLALAAAAAAVTAAILLARRVRRGGRPASAGPPRLMAIDSMYDLDTLRARGAEHIVTHRDLQGFFDHVWSVHPFAGVVPGAAAITSFGPPSITPLTSEHTMIEGRPGRFRRLAGLPYLNFVLAQAQLTLQLDRIVHEEGVAIIRGDPYYHGLLAWLLSALSGRPWEIRVIGNQDAIYETTGELAYARLFRWRFVELRVAHFTLTRADSVIVQSEYNREYAIRHGAPAERVQLGPMAIFVDPVHLVEPGEREPLAGEFGFGDRPVVAFVGRIEHVKHPQDVIVSVAKARRRDPRIAALLIGDGSLLPELAELCAQLGVQADVAFAGQRDQAWIARALPRCAVIAAPLSGLALVESALSATPIVAYDVEWHSEFLGAEREAIVVPYRDTDAMADAICALVADPERARRLGAAARAHALDVMRPSRLIGHERALAQGLMARGRSRA